MIEMSKLRYYIDIDFYIYMLGGTYLKMFEKYKRLVEISVKAI